MNKNIGVLWLIILIDLIGFGLTTPSFPLVLKQMNADPFWLTFAGPGVYSLFQLVFTPIWGRLSDAYGRRPILMLSMLGAFISYLMMAQADSVGMLIATRALGGIMSGNIGAAFAYVADVSEPKNRAKSIGILSSAFGLGFMLGPLIGGPLGTMGGLEISLRWPGPRSRSSGLYSCCVRASSQQIESRLAPRLTSPQGRHWRSCAVVPLWFRLSVPRCC